MDKASVLLSSVTVLIGATFPLQAGLNSSLGKAVQNPPFAALVSCVGTVVGVVFFQLVSRAGWPETAALGRAPGWSWFGGAMGACIVLAATILAPKLGSATFQAFVIGGQLACSLLLDHFAWVGFEPHPASGLRLLGLALMVGGVVLIAKF